jgi:hypothetical protein
VTSHKIIIVKDDQPCNNTAPLTILCRKGPFEVGQTFMQQHKLPRACMQLQLADSLVARCVALYRVNHVTAPNQPTVGGVLQHNLNSSALLCCSAV